MDRLVHNEILDEGNNKKSYSPLLAYFRDVVNVALRDNDIWVDDLIDIINKEAGECFVRATEHPEE